MKVLTLLGTRPEIIRLSRTMALLDRHVQHIIVHTGQNYDYELNGIFWEELELRKPDHFLNVDTSSLEAAVGDIIRKSGEVFRQEKPDAVLVLGDTNSCLGAYMAKRMHIPVFHMEAGNRSFDENVPEETNRRIIDHIADFNLVYTEHARRHLISEGLPHRRIYLTGSPMKEVLDYYMPKINNSRIFDKLPDMVLTDPWRNADSISSSFKSVSPGEYFIVSVHREENVDRKENLEMILNILNLLAEAYQKPVIVSTHPRTRKRLSSFKEYKINPLIYFLKPFGFIDYVHLQLHARCVISDSGTISEESAILSFPAISLRNSMERPEAQDAGTIILTSLNSTIVMKSIDTVIKEHEAGSYTQIPEEYRITNTSWRVLKLIIGYLGLGNTII